MTIKRTIVDATRQVNRLDAKISQHIKWVNEDVALTTKGLRIYRRLDRITNKYGLI